MKEVARRKIIIGVIIGCVLFLGGLIAHDVVLKQRARLAYAERNQVEVYNNVSNLYFTTDAKKKEVIEATRYGYWNGNFTGSLEVKK